MFNYEVLFGSILIFEKNWCPCAQDIHQICRFTLYLFPVFAGSYVLARCILFISVEIARFFLIIVWFHLMPLLMSQLVTWKIECLYLD